MRGAKTDIVNMGGDSLLHVASQHGKYDIVVKVRYVLHCLIHNCAVDLHVLTNLEEYNDLFIVCASSQKCRSVLYYRLIKSTFTISCVLHVY